MTRPTAYPMPTTESSDPLALLATHRPSDEDLLRDFPPAARAVVLDGVWRGTTAAASGTPPQKSRRVMRLAAASLALASAIGGASILWPKAGMPSASALQQLSGTARATAPLVIPAGQYAHQVTRSTQHGGAAGPGAPVPADSSRTRDTWIGADGVRWIHDDSGIVPQNMKVCPDSSFSSPDPTFVASMPTDPAALAAWVRARATGSTSSDEAVFVALGDLLRAASVPGAVRAAAVDVIAGLPGVTTTTTPRGTGSALEVTFRDEANRPGVAQILVFDPSTSVLVEERSTGDDLSYTATYEDLGITSSVPTSVTTGAVDTCGSSGTVKVNP